MKINEPTDADLLAEDMAADKNDELREWKEAMADWKKSVVPFTNIDCERQVRQRIQQELAEQAELLDSLSDSPTDRELGIIRGFQMAATFITRRFR